MSDDLNEEDEIDEKMKDILNEEDNDENGEDKNKSENESIDENSKKDNEVYEKDDNELDFDVNNNKVGHILVSDNYNPIIGAEESQVYTYIDPESRDGVSVGSYLSASLSNQDGNYHILSRVKQLRYTYEADINDKKPGGTNRDYRESNLSYIGRLKPISKVEIRDDRIVQDIVDRPPKPNEQTNLVENNKILKTGLNIPKVGDFAGYLSVGGEVIPNKDDPVPYLLSNPNATDGNSRNGEPQMFRHTIVSGKTGTGKTHFSKNILRQFSECKRFNIGDKNEQMESRLNITILDPENEYIKMRNDNEMIPKSDLESYKNNSDINLGGLNNSHNTECNIWVPSTSKSSTTITGAKEFSIPFEIVDSRESLIIPSEPGEETKRMIKEVIGSYFDSLDDNSNANYSEFSDWASSYLEDSDAMDSVTQAARSRIVDEKSLRNIFDKSGKPMTEIPNKIFKRGSVSVIPLKHLRDQEKQVVLSILSFIVDNKISADVDYPYIKNTPMLLCLDEAHKYLSSTDNAKQKYVVERFRKAARRGRKDKFGLFTVTQNPQDIDDIVRNQINTKIYLQLGENVVNKSSMNVPDEYKKRITTLGKGEAIINAPDTRPVEVKGLSNCLTEH